MLFTSGPGYTLRIGPGDLDRDAFERTAAGARAARDADRLAESAELFRAALDLSRGPALADVAYEPWAAREAARLEELRLSCVEDRIDVELELGRHGELVPELHALVEEHPLRERLRGLLILALYRSGRQAEALEAYQAARRTLVDELGIDPSPALRELETAILRQDEALAAPSESGRAAGDVPGLESLPRPPSTFVGRARELEDVTGLMRDPRVRLVTLTGPGGTGKTRLALEVASEAAQVFRQGVWWVGAEAVRDPAALVPLIAATLGVEDLPGPLASGTALVVLDNLEQLIEAGPELVGLLDRAPGLTFLVTSRERLHVTGEHEYGVPPLAEPEAVELFLERARAVRPSFADDGAVAAICRRVDCLPLGVELSAVRVNVLEPTDILERLDHRLALLTGGPRDHPERQRTVRAAIEWSHDLLSEEESVLFRRLAVFADGFTIDAAEQVCGAELDVLASLVDKSLLRRTGSRFSMLGTIHEYARERLEAAGEAEEVGRAQLDWCLALVRRLSEDTGGATTPASLAALTVERENFRLALRQASALGADATAFELTVELAEADFWRLPAPLAEGRAELEHVLGSWSGGQPPLRARALYEAAVLAVMQGDAAGVVALAEDLLALARSEGDPMATVRSLAMLAALAAERRDEPTAVRLSEEAVSIATDADDERGLLNALNSRAVVDLSFARYQSARELFERCVELARAVARRPHSVATAIFNVGLACVLADELEEAERRLGESLLLSRELGDPDGIAYCFAAEAELRARRGEWPEAARLLAAARHLLDEIGAELESVELRVYDGTLDAVRAALGEAELAAAWREGRTLADAELAAAAEPAG